MRVVSLHVYPVKGARAIDLERSDLFAGGLRNDRRFMLVDPDGVFLSQRSHPRLALVETAIEGDALLLAAPSGRIAVPLAPEGPRTRVRIWKNDVDAVLASSEASELLSEHLGDPCRLVFMPRDVIRPVDPRFALPGDEVGFADGYPVLVATLASLADLNTRIEASRSAKPGAPGDESSGRPSIPMTRFRPNIVLDGNEAFEEDRFTRLRVGDVMFRTPKRCARCEVTTVDQQTAEVGKEPLRTLATYRRDENKVHFAMNAIPELRRDDVASIAIGDDAEGLAT